MRFTWEYLFCYMRYWLIIHKENIWYGKIKVYKWNNPNICLGWGNHEVNTCKVWGINYNISDYKSERRCNQKICQATYNLVVLLSKRLKHSVRLRYGISVFQKELFNQANCVL